MYVNYVLVNVQGVLKFICKLNFEIDFELLILLKMRVGGLVKFIKFGWCLISRYGDNGYIVE